MKPPVSFENLRQDLRYSARLLAGSRTSSAVAIVSLAFGIGATTSVFSAVDRTLFRSLPYGHADRLVSVGISFPSLPYDFMFGASYLDLRRSQTAFSAVTSWTGVSDCDLTDGEPIRLSCAAVESTFLSTLEIVPVLGRSFNAAEDRPDQPLSVLLSFGLWQSRFGGQADIIGHLVSLDGQPARVVGVLPRDFETPTLVHADLLIPQGSDDATLARATTGRPLRVIARLRPGMRLSQARAVGDATVARMLPEPRDGLAREAKPRVQTLRDLQVGDAKLASWFLLGAVGAVLLLACANVANLLLAQNVMRQRELAIRVALGAGRIRLARLAFSESLILVSLGDVAGSLMAYGLLKLFVNAAPQGIPHLSQAGIDMRVLAFTVLCSLSCALIFGMVPAFAQPTPEALSGGRSVAGRRSSASQVLIVAQLAFSLALLTAAGLLVHALWKIQRRPLGIEATQVMTASISLPRERYPDVGRQLAFAEKLEERLRNTAGLMTVTVSDSNPPQVPLRSKPMGALEIDGRPPESAGVGTVVWRAVTPAYFRVLRIPIVQGRGFIEQDRDPGRDVMIVSQSLARRLFHNRDVVGRSVNGVEIVGVAGDVRNSGGTASDDPEYYVPRSHSDDAFIYRYPDELRRLVAIIRTPLAPQAAGQAIHSVVTALDGALPVKIETLSASTGRLSVRPRFNAMLLALFAAIALALSACGVYGLLGFLVAQRTREIGVRVALGATPMAIFNTVLRKAGYWLAAGVGCGLVLSLAMSRAIGSLLYGVPKLDPTAWLLAVAVLVGVALGAALWPSWRAVRIDPIEALRHE
ncbi:MAG TPA: ABC transporter permease [Bryobacteraceae bacterium]|nr:ABC transporter permease [Bryobacteraceae bacterium]